jgi:transcriptional regulator with XRE-family HTH domain
MAIDNNISLKNLGDRLRSERLKRNESQTLFAARIGVSIPTLRKMESGDPSVMIGYWVTSLDVLDRIKDLDTILAEPVDLFEKFEQQKAPGRRRASKKRAP